MFQTTNQIGVAFPSTNSGSATTTIHKMCEIIAAQFAVVLVVSVYKTSWASEKKKKHIFRDFRVRYSGAHLEKPCDVSTEPSLSS